VATTTTAHEADLNGPELASRRAFLLGTGGALLTLGMGGSPQIAGAGDSEVTLCLLGDLMTGRGIDQVLPHPSPPRLYERYAKSAAIYVDLAEEVNGPIPAPVDLAYVWGEALDELEGARPDLLLANLETSVTRSDEPWAGKGIHYRMHPGNVGCLTAGGVDCCVLANNHVLDWSRAGLLETLEALAQAGLATVGAGRDLSQASAPAILDTARGPRVVVYACATTDSGVPQQWAAKEGHPGVNLLPDLSTASARAVAAHLDAMGRSGDIVVVSIHWGGNWGYEVPAEKRHFAHRLIDEAGVDVVHGHSSHHPRPLEVYRGRLILYGCGDFLNDYEGISGHERYRSELVLMYLAALDAASGRLVRLTMAPFHLRRFQPRRADPAEARWLASTLSREGEGLGTRVETFQRSVGAGRDEPARLQLVW
jgi:poly-gamma-glutamate synthesis protein (capsule biosynthesis protein)